ncbi:glutamate ABC transporter substrate-binding protein [Actinacidiphila yanglinensis]|nr:glutamate ABC transporter substrate-binding protein [Actinacidiphila yanglinensis]
MRRGRWAAATAGLVVAAVLGTGGCAAPSGTDHGGGREPGPHGALPQAAPAGLPGSAPADDESCHPLESYRPQGSMPQPGHMPSGSTMAAIVKRGRLIAGVDQNSYLFGYRNPLTGELDGFEIELLKRISTALFGSPDRIQFKTISSNARLAVLQPDKTTHRSSVDIVIDSMTINCDRWKSVAFSTDYMDAGQRVLVPKSSTATSIDDLGGKRVCAASGTTSIDTLKGLKKHPVVPVAVKDWTDCLMLMQVGKVDAVSTDDTILIGLAAQDPNTKLIGPRFTKEPHGIAMRKDQTDLVRFVNGVLQQMRQDGTLTGLEKQWLGADAKSFVPPPGPSYKPE